MDVFMRLPEEGSKQRADQSAPSGNQSEQNRSASRERKMCKEAGRSDFCGGRVHWGEEAALADGAAAGAPAMRTGRPSRMR